MRFHLQSIANKKELPVRQFLLLFMWLLFKAVFVLELLNASAGADELLLTCKERMAL